MCIREVIKTITWKIEGNNYLGDLAMDKKAVMMGILKI
jgi:hypothetical protein